MAQNGPVELQKELATVANAIVSGQKGILAADEALAGIGQRLASVGLENTAENRQKFRHMMFKTKGLGKNLGGVILEKETLYQKDASGKPIVKALTDQGIRLGVKVDLGWLIMPGTMGEMTTQGLDGLAERCAQYKADGASFTKWRCPLKIQGNGLTPSQCAINQAAEISGRYAAIAQAAGLVPIVEPDVMLDGDHSIEVCQRVTERVLLATFKALHDHNVFIEGILLKTNMVTPGAKCVDKASNEKIAQMSVQSYKRTVPSAMPGIVFLSGGQSPLDATKNLQEMNKIPNLPWRLTYSYSRAIQGPVLTAWKDKGSDDEEAQKALLYRTTCNSLASNGKYDGEEQTTGLMKSLHIENYAY